MSLINKMLQDLDARGATAGQSLQGDVRPVPGRERRFPLRSMLAGAALILAAILALLAWRLMQAPHAGVLQARRPVAPAAAAVLPAPVAPAVPVVAPALPAVLPAPVVAPVLPVVAPALAPAVHPPLLKASAGANDAMGLPAARHKALPAAHPGARPAAAAAVDAARLSPGPDLLPRPGLNSGLNSRQKAENEYRRALAALQEGRTGETIAGLERALAAEPHHDAARQTLIGLMVESGRPDDAMVQLQTGLGLDVKQAPMAMLLARLQLERGGPALGTLMRTLPYAAGNGPYQAFLAAVLERDGRHAEAAGHYRLALQTAPQNGLWWMGLGLALQADQHAVQARDAFAHAKAASNLTPGLRAFVEHQLLLLTP